MWIARDKNGSLCMYKTKPVRLKTDAEFRPNNSADLGEWFELTPKLNKEITWENSPQKVKEIII